VAPARGDDRGGREPHARGRRHRRDRHRAGGRGRAHDRRARRPAHRDRAWEHAREPHAQPHAQRPRRRHPTRDPQRRGRPPPGNGADMRETVKVYPFGLSWNRVEEAARGLGLPVAIVREPDDADVVITLKNYYRRKTPRLRNAESAGIPIYIARSNSSTQIASALASVIELRRGPEDQALDEAREAIEEVP